MEDHDILLLFEARNEDAIRKTAEKYGDYCHAIAMRILFDHADAEECVNDTWLGAWNSIPPQKPRSLKLYLAKIVRNLSFNRYKEKTSKKRGGGDMTLALDELAEITASSSDVETELEKKELKEALDRFLRALPRRETDIFLRRYFFAESFAEIASRYGMRESAVRMSLSRTREKLREYLKKEMNPS